MKKLTPLQLCLISFCVAINFIGAAVALTLKLPIYLDTIGTMLTAALLGPIYGILPGLISGLISGFTTDVIALYYIPVQMITGIMAGLLFHTNFLKKWKLPIGTLAIALPGTITSSLITTFIFGGITSSGSTIFVQILNQLGLGMTTSVFLVQIITDYADRLVAIAIIYTILAAIPYNYKNMIKKGVHRGTI